MTKICLRVQLVINNFGDADKYRMSEFKQITKELQDSCAERGVVIDFT